MTTKKKTGRKSKSKSAAHKQATKPAQVNVSQRCRQACPLNLGSAGSHRGVCYLDATHTGRHKCSVDGFEWS
jgi:hypothetical protein